MEEILGTVPLTWYLTVSAALFCIGLYGVLARRNAISILMGVELILNAANLNFIAFWRYVGAADFDGVVFALIVMTIAACEATVGLALIVGVFRNRRSVDLNNLDLLRG